MPTEYKAKSFESLSAADWDEATMRVPDELVTRALECLGITEVAHHERRAMARLAAFLEIAVKQKARRPTTAHVRAALTDIISLTSNLREGLSNLDMESRRYLMSGLGSSGDLFLAGTVPEVLNHIAKACETAMPEPARGAPRRDHIQEWLGLADPLYFNLTGRHLSWSAMEADADKQGAESPAFNGDPSLDFLNSLCPEGIKITLHDLRIFRASTHQSNSSPK